MKNLRLLGTLFVASIMMCALCICASAMTYSGSCGADGNNVTWTLDTDTGELAISGKGEMRDLFLSNPWDAYRDSIITITIGKGVTTIGGNAFEDCKNLTSVAMPDGIAVIRNYAFCGCSKLGNVTIPKSVESIGNNAFSGCSSFTNISIPNSTKIIGFGAFRGCSSLADISISDGITVMGTAAFCDTAYYNDLANWESGALYLGRCLIAADDSIQGSYFIKDGTTMVGGEAFYECAELESIIIPSSVKNIGEGSFYGCSKLNHVSLPEGMIDIGEKAFFMCSSLSDITIPNGVVSIGEDALRGTAYYDDTENWDNNVLYCGNHLIAAETSIEGICSVKEGTITIACSAFKNCKALSGVTIPDSVANIGRRAFYNCTELKNVSIPDGITSIEDYAFYNCAIENITIPDGVIRISGGAFKDCRLTGVAIPNSVTSIGEYAFDVLGLHLMDVVYIGDETDWNNITIGLYNDDLANARRHYVSSMEDICTLTLAEPENGTASLNSTVTGKGETVTVNWLPAVGYDLDRVFVDGVKISGASFTATGNNTVYVTFKRAFDFERGGYCGEYLYWALDSDGVLHICGTGTMADYSSASVPWNYWRNSITAVEIGDGVTSISNSAFGGCKNLPLVHYGGTADEWELLTKELASSDYLRNVSRHYLIKKDIAATCTQEGQQECLFCEACQKVFRQGETTPLASHDLVHYDGQAATLCASGWEAYDTCKNCDYSTYVEIPMISAEKVCDHCHGTGESNSYHDCPQCEEGKIKTLCQTCHGNGYIKEIDGYETETCSLCNGTGSVKNTIECNACKGIGYIVIYQCSAGHAWTYQNYQTVCPVCYRIGTVLQSTVCSACFATGEIVLSKKDCPNCGGDGEVATTPIYSKVDCTQCTDGYTYPACTLCGGTGCVKSECEVCRGSGKVLDWDTIHQYRILQFISIINAPTKTQYIAGQSFDPLGMEIIANYDYGESETVAIEDLSYSAAALKVSDTAVTISYGGKTAEQRISVLKAYDLVVDENTYQLIANVESKIVLAIAYYSEEGKLISVSLTKKTVENGIPITGALDAGNCKIMILDTDYVPLTDCWDSTVKKQKVE